MPRGSIEQTRERQALAWELSVKGWTDRRIAEEIERRGLGKISRQGVSKLLARLESKALARLTERAAGQKARQTAALQFAYGEAMEAWERSKEPSKSVTKQVGDGGEKTTTHVKDQDGDPRFLEQARAAMADLRKLWGLDAAHKVALGGDSDAPPIRTSGGVDWSKATADELRAVLNVIDGIESRGESRPGGSGVSASSAGGEESV